MMNALWADAAEDCGITYQAPVDALVAAYSHPMICRARVGNPSP